MASRQTHVYNLVRDKPDERDLTISFLEPRIMNQDKNLQTQQQSAQRIITCGGKCFPKKMVLSYK
jgi:hypothetical protein